MTIPLLIGALIVSLFIHAWTFWLYIHYLRIRNDKHCEVIHELTSKLMAKNLGDYQVQKKVEENTEYPSLSGSDKRYAEIEKHRGEG